MKVERDDDHRYWLTRDDGTRDEAIGVTRTLIENNLIDDTWFTDQGRGRGRLAHFFAERIATNTLDRPIEASIAGPMIGLRKFLDKFGPTVRNAEVILINPNRLLGGGIDLDVEIDRSAAVIDIKLSSPTHWHGLQLAPYAYLLDGAKWLSRQRLGLYLTHSGGYRLKEYDDTTDLDYFFRAFELLHWRLKRGSHARPYGRPARTDRDPNVLDEDRDWRDRVDGDSIEF
jgi:hypothetical protein